MNYLYADIARSSCNFGNRVIDHAVRLRLAAFLPPPAAEFDAFSTDRPGGDYDFTVLPGCTMLTAGHYPGLAGIDWRKPVYCLGGSIWSPPERRGFLVRSRVVGRRPPPPPDLSVARAVAEPVGVRDGYTYRALSGAGIRATYVGCPTLFLPAEGVGDDGYVLLSFGRGRVREQCAAGKKIARRYPVVGICHETGDCERYRAAGWNLPLVGYMGDLDLFLSYFRRASVVVTGRLHGALPSIAFGKRIFYYGTNDSRISLLDDLGVAVHGYGEIGRGPEEASGAWNRGFLDRLRENLDALLALVAARGGAPPPAERR